jgi:hypothetical protein
MHKKDAFIVYRTLAYLSYRTYDRILSVWEERRQSFFFILCDLPRRGTEVVRLLNNPNFNDTTFTSFLKYRVTVVSHFLFGQLSDASKARFIEFLRWIRQARSSDPLRTYVLQQTTTFLYYLHNKTSSYLQHICTYRAVFHSVRSVLRK